MPLTCSTGDVGSSRSTPRCGPSPSRPPVTTCGDAGVTASSPSTRRARSCPSQREAFRGLTVAPYDPAWRFQLEVRPAAATQWEVQTGTDGIVPFERLGVVSLPGLGDVDVWRLTTYGGGVFLPLRDAGCGTSGGGYAGGRYVLDTVKGADLGCDGGHLVIDLNFAYAPSCAYDPAWACPLAPAGNRVEVAVPVGELQP